MQGKEYEIEGRIFTHRKMVLGQMRDFILWTTNLIFTEGMGVGEFVVRNMPSLPAGLAIVLVEKGKGIKGRDLPGIAEFMELNMDPAMVLEVVEDFFAWNRPAFILKKLDDLQEMAKGLMIGSTGPSSSSPEEISSNATKSSGDSISKSANPT